MAGKEDTVVNRNKALATKGTTHVALSAGPETLLQANKAKMEVPNACASARLGEGQTSKTFVKEKPIWTKKGVLDEPTATGFPSGLPPTGDAVPIPPLPPAQGQLSGSFCGPTKAKSASEEVFIEREGVVRTGDETWQNWGDKPNINGTVHGGEREDDVAAAEELLKKLCTIRKLPGFGECSHGDGGPRKLGFPVGTEATGDGYYIEMAGSDTLKLAAKPWDLIHKADSQCKDHPAAAAMWEWVDTPPKRPVLFMVPVAAPKVDAEAKVEITPRAESGWLQTAIDERDMGGPSRSKFFFVSPQGAPDLKLPDRPEYKKKKSKGRRTRQRNERALQRHPEDVKQWEADVEQRKAKHAAAEDEAASFEAMMAAVADVAKAIDLWRLAADAPLRKIRAQCCAGPVEVQFRLYPEQLFCFNFFNPALLTKFNWIKKLVEKAQGVYEWYKTVKPLASYATRGVEVEPDWAVFESPKITLDCQFVELTPKGIAAAKAAAASNAPVAPPPEAAAPEAPPAPDIAAPGTDTVFPDFGTIEEEPAPFPPYTGDLSWSEYNFMYSDQVKEFLAVGQIHYDASLGPLHELPIGTLVHVGRRPMYVDYVERAPGVYMIFLRDKPPPLSLRLPTNVRETLAFDLNLLAAEYPDLFRPVRPSPYASEEPVVTVPNEEFSREGRGSLEGYTEAHVRLAYRLCFSFNPLARLSLELQVPLEPFLIAWGGIATAALTMARKWGLLEFDGILGIEVFVVPSIFAGVDEYRQWVQNGMIQIGVRLWLGARGEIGEGTKIQITGGIRGSIYFENFRSPEEQDAGAGGATKSALFQFDYSLGLEWGFHGVISSDWLHVQYEFLDSWWDTPWKPWANDKGTYEVPNPLAVGAAGPAVSMDRDMMSMFDGQAMGPR